jgi:PAS domain S-box-containing protein
MIVLGLLHNIALLVMLVVLRQFIGRRWTRRVVRSDFLSGLLFGAVGIIGMLTPVHFAPGAIFDSRSVILCVAGFAGGPIVAALAAALCIAYRLWLGGIGAWIGTAVIIEATMLGLLFRVLSRRDARLLSLPGLWGFGVVVHVGMLLIFLAFPGGIARDILSHLTLPVLALYPLATMLVCWLFLDHAVRLNMEQRMAESEDRYRQLFEAESDAILLIDNEEGQILEANEAAAMLYGYSRDELLTKKNTDLSAEPDSTRSISRSTPAVGDHVITIPLRWHRKADGTLFPVEITGRFFSRNGRAVHIAAIRDITLRKQAEDSLLQANHKLYLSQTATLNLLEDLKSENEARKNGEAAIVRIKEEWERTFNTVPDLICILDAQHKIRRVNRAMAVKMGMSPEQAVGVTCYQAVHGLQRPPDSCPHAKLIEDQMEHSAEVHEARLGGDFFVTCTPLRDRDGQLVGSVHVARDVTEYNRAAQEREVMRAQLIQSQKLEAIGTLAGGVAHEINNPLMGIMGYAQLILDKPDGDAEVRTFAGEINEESKRIAMIVKNLLQFSRLDKDIYRSAVQVCDIVTATLGLIQTVMRHDQVDLLVNVPGTLPLVSCRSQQIQQVLMNLMTNARDALNQRYPGHDANKKILITAREITGEDARWVRVTVEDHGTGIPVELRQRIFDPFFTTKDRTKGTGLGLSVSHGIVMDHGGRLSVESEVGQWTRFHLDLPVGES